MRVLAPRFGPKFQPRRYSSLTDTTINTAEALDTEETVIDCDANPTSAIAVGDKLRIEDESSIRVTATNAVPANITVTRLYPVAHDTAKDIYKVSKSDCVLWLPGQDDQQSAIIRDRSGFGNHGTITGATWVRLPSGLWVMNFDGNDYVDCGAGSSLDITTTLTLMAWAKTTNNNSGGIIIKDNSAAQRSYLLHFDTNIIRFQVLGLDDTYLDWTSATWYDGYWHFIVGAYDGSTKKIYFDGTEKASEASTGSISTGTTSLRIGNRNAGVNDLLLIGQVALPRVFSRASSASEIAQIYNQERHLFRV